jgi:hypothetical protein
MSNLEKGEANTVINMAPLLANKAKRNAAASIAKLAKLRSRLPVIHENEVRINANGSSPKATGPKKSRKYKSRKTRKSRK